MKVQMFDNMKTERHNVNRQLLTAIGASMLILANVVAVKIIPIPLPLLGAVEASAGVFPIAVVFFCTDVISERYGRQAAQDAVKIMLFVLILGWGVLQTAVYMPRVGGVKQAAFASVVGASTSLVVASVLTAVVSQLIDVQLFHYIKDYTDGQHKWFRNIGSTSVSQLLDTALFSMLAFIVVPSTIGGVVLPFSVVLSIIVVEYIVRVSVAVVDTPLFYALTHTNE